MHKANTSGTHAEGSVRDALILSNLRDSIIVTDVNGVVTYWNEGATRIFGWTAAEMLGRPMMERFPPEGREWLAAEIAKRAAGVEWDGEFLDYRKDGSRVWIDARVRQLRDENGTVVGIVGISHDITERKRLEGEVLQLQKMEAVGRLAGGVAHDFNNLLTIINGYVQQVLDEVQAPDVPELLQEVLKAGERAAELTRQLLAYSRKQVVQPQAVDLNGMISDAARMLRRVIGEDIELTLQLDPAVPRVHADPGQLTQVLMNLCVNARDAMPTGGTLTVQTRRQNLTPETLPARSRLQAGPCLHLTIRDTGIGMSEETLQRIFDPFFTTKPQGHGTGLGLATVQGIVHQSGGYIAARSTPGGGTTFDIFFPASSEERHAEQQNVHATGGTETVLLVEDEDSVRLLTQLTLERAGYTVLVAKNGERALEVLAGHQAPIHLLLTDVVMPRVGGRQVAEVARLAHASLRVLYMSGYTDDAVTRHGISCSERAFIQKPFGPRALLRRVREVLDATDNAELAAAG